MEAEGMSQLGATSCFMGSLMWLDLQKEVFHTNPVVLAFQVHTNKVDS